MDNFMGHDEGKWRQDRNDLTLLFLLSPQPNVRMFPVLQPVLDLVRYMSARTMAVSPSPRITKNARYSSALTVSPCRDNK